MHAEDKLTYETWPAEPEKSTLEAKNKFLGFWFFLGGETVLFASLFATYLALKDKVPDSTHTLAKDLYDLPLTFVATMLLLTSSLTSVYAMYHMKNFNAKKMNFHGGHVAFGLLWITTLIVRNAKRGLDLYNAPKFYVASLYWHFIDVVWVFIFTVVYLMGMVG
jgi:cytochrome c oxidase subunit 3